MNIKLKQAAIERLNQNFGANLATDCTDQDVLLAIRAFYGRLSGATAAKVVAEFMSTVAKPR